MPWGHCVQEGVGRPLQEEEKRPTLGGKGRDLVDKVT